MHSHDWSVPCLGSSTLTTRTWAGAMPASPNVRSLLEPLANQLTGFETLIWGSTNDSQKSAQPNYTRKSDCSDGTVPCSAAPFLVSPPARPCARKSARRCLEANRTPKLAWFFSRPRHSRYMIMKKPSKQHPRPPTIWALCL